VSPAVGLGAFIGVGRSLDQAFGRVEVAEQLGYESVFVTHIGGRDSITLLTGYAARTSRVQLGTGVIPIYARTPANMAQSFATLDDISGGRAIAGLGCSHKPVVEHWFNQSIDKPLAEMREYVAIMRAILRGEDPPAGEKFRTAFHLTGWEAPRPDMPIYLAGLSPGMLRLSGEIADGVVLWLCNPNYVRDVVVPSVREGREKAGRDLDGFDIVAAVPSAVTDDPDAARARLREEVTPYFGLPYYRAMLERSGLDPDAGPTDEFLGILGAIGSADEAKASVRRYAESGATSPCVGGIGGTDFDATLGALAHSLD
jgi:alkanesulfonate monooxygenase SsuD/methylene tetrahydromethanopterin reductase-like flavin-dependent oxidoreductase (luciferase family)